MTRFPEIFNRLMEPFHPVDVRSRSGSDGKQFSYITARTAQNRLDDVLGPENWEFSIRPWDNSALIGTLTVTFPDGTKVSKSAVGGRAGMKAQDDDAKSAASDCLKCCASMLGVGRYLYKDGVPTFDSEPEPAPVPAAAPQAATKPKDTRSYWQIVCDAKQKLVELGGYDYNAADVHWMLMVLASTAKKADIPQSNVSQASITRMEQVYKDEPQFVREALQRFVQQKIKPHHIDTLFKHEREPGKPISSEDVGTFIYGETNVMGRGNRDEAFRFIESELKVTRASLASMFQIEGGRKEILDSLRRYLDSHPTTLAPIVQGAAA